jgi:hypothetical protein
MATVTLTGKNASEVRRWCRAILAGISPYDDNRALGTVTATDASPMVVTTTDTLGNSTVTTI